MLPYRRPPVVSNPLSTFATPSFTSTLWFRASLRRHLPGKRDRSRAVHPVAPRRLPWPSTTSPLAVADLLPSVSPLPRLPPPTALGPTSRAMLHCRCAGRHSPAVASGYRVARPPVRPRPRPATGSGPPALLPVFPTAGAARSPPEWPRSSSARAAMAPAAATLGFWPPIFVVIADPTLALLKARMNRGTLVETVIEEGPEAPLDELIAAKEMVAAAEDINILLPALSKEVNSWKKVGRMNLNERISGLQKEFKLGSLKAEFDKEQTPLYLSVLDVMSYKLRLLDFEWSSLINHIVNKRVLVVEDWNKSYGSVRRLVFDFGIKGPPNNDLSYMKGESDASYDSASGSGTARISNIIWRGNQIIWVEVFENVKCPSSVTAEALAALSLLFKCIDLKVAKLVVWTDNEAVCGYMDGGSSIDLSADPDNLCYLLQSEMRKQFEHLVPLLKPRELLYIPDQILRSVKQITSGDLDDTVNEVVKDFSTNIAGMPVFQILQHSETNRTIKYLKKVCQGYVHFPKSTFYLKVDPDSRFKKVAELIELFKPSKMSFVVERFQEKSESFQKEIINYGFLSFEEVGGISIFYYGENGVHDATGKNGVHDATGKNGLHDATGKNGVHDATGKNDVHDATGKKRLILVFDAKVSNREIPANPL
ncbi:hypothetical protein ACP4OV_031770 [Aristida adscensionis]